MKAWIPLLLLLATAAHASDRIERGRYLVTTGGCADCHTPLRMGAKGPEPDPDRHLSGHPQALVIPAAVQPPAGPWLAVIAVSGTAFSGPWGVSFAANLTPDAETGLGRWSENDFIQTLRTARHLGRGREVLPPMPVAAYGQMTDADLQAIFAYLKSLPPIRNQVPSPIAPTAAAGGR